MSVIEIRAAAASLDLRRLARTAMLCVAAVAAVAIGLAILSWIILGITASSAPVAHNPFGLTVREVKPSLTGFGAIILALQAQFYAALTAAVQALKSGHAATVSIATIGFLYGIFHAAGPGHGKGVISAYMVAHNRSIRLALGLSLAAALLQAIVAIALVGTLAVILKASATSINATARAIELASFAGIACLGLALVWWKAKQLDGLLFGSSAAEMEDEHFAPIAARKETSWRKTAAVILAAGIRPCTGAILLLVLSLSQGLFVAGVLGALAMAVSTAITTGSLAVLAVFARRVLGWLSGRGKAGVCIEASFELLAAGFVLVLGLVLLTGLWVGLPSALD
jgi:ABC-type nickel/cobalt efflux system permease component RcnA